MVSVARAFAPLLHLLFGCGIARGGNSRHLSSAGDPARIVRQAPGRAGAPKFSRQLFLQPTV